MDFVDGTLVRLADPATRAALFDQDALASLIAAAYDTDTMAITPPFNPIFDRLEIGLSVVPPGTLDGYWSGPTGADRTEFRLRGSGFGGQTPIRVDAVWRGGIVVRTLPLDSTIVAVNVRRADLDVVDIDVDIAAALGGLPADPVVLEAERRARVLARIRAGMNEPTAFGDPQLDRWLASLGVATVTALLETYRSVASESTLQITFSPPAGGAPSPKTLPFAAALLIRGPAVATAELLSESKLVRARLADDGLAAPSERGTRQRSSLVIVWMVPAALFDDADWPGAAPGMNAAQARAARRAAAAQWLAREGIGLVTVT